MPKTVCVNPFGTAVPFCLSSLSSKRDCSPKRVNPFSTCAPTTAVPGTFLEIVYLGIVWVKNCSTAVVAKAFTYSLPSKCLCPGFEPQVGRTLTLFAQKKKDSIVESALQRG